MSAHAKRHVYLLHFHSKLFHAQHYIGLTSNIEARLAAHTNGQSGVKMITNGFFANGIPFDKARTWTFQTEHAARAFESYLKRTYKHTARLCPFCSADAACWMTTPPGVRKGKSFIAIPDPANAEHQDWRDYQNTIRTLMPGI